MEFQSHLLRTQFDKHGKSSIPRVVNTVGDSMEKPKKPESVPKLIIEKHSIPQKQDCFLLKTKYIILLLDYTQGGGNLKIF